MMMIPDAGEREINFSIEIPSTPALLWLHNPSWHYFGQLTALLTFPLLFVVLEAVNRLLNLCPQICTVE